MSFDLDSFELVVGGLMWHPEWYDEFSASLSAVDFHSSELSGAVKVIEHLNQEGGQITPEVVSAHLDEDLRELVDYWADGAESLDFTTWRSLLHRCTAKVTGSLLADKLLSIQDGFSDPSFDVNQALCELGDVKEGIEARLSATKNNAISYADAAREALLSIQRQADGLQTSRVSSGIPDLDEMILGFEGGDLVIIGARPSMGKTAFSMGIIESAALRDEPCLVFSVEMKAADLAMRSLASLGDINLQNMRKGRLSEFESSQLYVAAEKIKSLPIIVDDTPGLTISQLEATVLREHKKRPLRLIMLDYLQLMSLADLKGSNSGEQIGEISRRLKLLGKKLDLPIIVLSQLNRELERRPDKRPVSSDLKQSGNIEQDADIIIFLYRDEVYNENTPDKGIAEIIIGKQRNGPTGTVFARFIANQAKFKGMIEDSDEEAA